VSEKQNKKELSDTSGVAENPKKKNYEARDNHIKKKYGDTVDLLGKRRQEGPVHLWGGGGELKTMKKYVSKKTVENHYTHRCVVDLIRIREK